jgi:hypothetical protein
LIGPSNASNILALAARFGAALTVFLTLLDFFVVLLFVVLPFTLVRFVAPLFRMGAL